MEENMTEENIVPGSSPKKSRKKLLVGGLIASVLLLVVIVGTTSNFFGAFQVIDELEDGHFVDEYENSTKCKYKENQGGYFCVDGCTYFEDFYRCDGVVYEYEEEVNMMYDACGEYVPEDEADMDCADDDGTGEVYEDDYYYGDYQDDGTGEVYEEDPCGDGFYWNGYTCEPEEERNWDNWEDDDGTGEVYEDYDDGTGEVY